MRPEKLYLVDIVEAIVPHHLEATSRILDTDETVTLVHLLRPTDVAPGCVLD